MTTIAGNGPLPEGVLKNALHGFVAGFVRDGFAIGSKGGNGKQQECREKNFLDRLHLRNPFWQEKRIYFAEVNAELQLEFHI
jgi:hypothetical protein